jgi:hypothetical protein
VPLLTVRGQCPTASAVGPGKIRPLVRPRRLAGHATRVVPGAFPGGANRRDIGSVVTWRRAQIALLSPQAMGASFSDGRGDPGFAGAGHST